VSTQQPPPPPPGDEWPARADQPAVQSTEETVVAPAGPPPEEPDSRIGKGLLVGILLVALVAAAIVAAYFLTRDDKKQTTTVLVTTHAGGSVVSVPRLVGLKESEALIKLSDAGLRPKETFKPTKKATGLVVSQDPPEATDVKKGSQVKLVIDSGAPKVAVPDVTGLPADEAVQKLDAVGLDSQQTTVTSDKTPGTVVDEAPAAGQKVAKGSVVVLSVSKAAPVAVPDVVGKAQADATATLQNAGFKVNVAMVPGAQPKGTVIAQNPAAGAKADRGIPVRINVSTGAGAATTTGTTTTTTTTPASATVPNLQGTQLQAAVQQLGQSGLLASVAYIPGTDPLETVLQQSPAAGSTLKARSHVTLNVSSGPGEKAQKTVPDATGKTLSQAVAAMQSAGLRLIYAKLPVTDRALAGKVVEQSPKAGSTAPQNAQVLVYIGAFRQ
jgi:beta-lactam-binding protein with PASTA domain